MGPPRVSLVQVRNSTRQIFRNPARTVAALTIRTARFLNRTPSRRAPLTSHTPSTSTHVRACSNKRLYASPGILKNSNAGPGPQILELACEGRRLKAPHPFGKPARCDRRPGERQSSGKVPEPDVCAACVFQVLRGPLLICSNQGPLRISSRPPFLGRCTRSIVARHRECATGTGVSVWSAAGTWPPEHVGVRSDLCLLLCLQHAGPRVS